MWSEINWQEEIKKQEEDQLPKAIGLRWYRQVLKKEKNNFLRGALDIEVKGTRGRGRLKKTWLKAVVEQSRKVGLKKVMPITDQDGN